MVLETVQSLKNRIIFKIYGQFRFGIAHFQKEKDKSEVYSEVKEVAERFQTDYHVVLPILDGHAGCDKQFTTIA